ncbi:MAG: phosphotransferase [Alphaproteobacteria bacterium]
MDRGVVDVAVGRLFPGACEVASRAHEVAPEARFWVIPGRRGPRWIVPQNPRHGWPALGQWRPYHPLSRQKWALLTTAYRAGSLGRVPGVEAVGVAGEAEWSRLGWNGGAAPVPAIYIGTPGPARKAVATLVAADTRTPASVVKAPLGPRAAERVLREAEMLERLAVDKPGMAPRIVCVDRSRGVAVQEPVAGRLSGRRLSRAHLGWLDRLRGGGNETSIAAHVERLRTRLVALDGADGDESRPIATALDAIADRAPLPAGWTHGDFAPWNLKWQGRGKLAAIDWEAARPDGLPLQDLFHFHFVQAYLLGARPALKTFSTLPPAISQFAESAGIGAAVWRRLLLFYLAEAWVVRTEEDEPAHAAFLAARIARELAELT